MALIGRLLEAQGFRVGIISQPDWQFGRRLPRARQTQLFYGITAGNMDSMINRYTADRKSAPTTPTPPTPSPTSARIVRSSFTPSVARRPIPGCQHRIG